jgi:hypothetical protein
MMMRQNSRRSIRSFSQSLLAFAVPVFLLLPLVPGFLIVAPTFLLSVIDAVYLPRSWFRSYFYYLHLPFVILAYAFQLVAAAALFMRKTWARIAVASSFRIYSIVLVLVAALMLAGATVFAARGEWGGSVALVTQALSSTIGAALLGWIARRMASKRHSHVT